MRLPLGNFRSSALGAAGIQGSTMKMNIRAVAAGLAGAILAIGLAAFTSTSASAQSLEDKIGSALKSKATEGRPLTRSLGGRTAVDPKKAEEQRFIEKIRDSDTLHRHRAPGPRGGEGSEGGPREDRRDRQGQAEDRPSRSTSTSTPR